VVLREGLPGGPEAAQEIAGLELSYPASHAAAAQDLERSEPVQSSVTLGAENKVRIPTNGN
jgi:hypothetical protein